MSAWDHFQARQQSDMGEPSTRYLHRLLLHCGSRDQARRAVPRRSVVICNRSGRNCSTIVLPFFCPLSDRKINQRLGEGQSNASADLVVVHICSFCCVIQCYLHFIENVSASSKGLGGRWTFFDHLPFVVMEGFGARRKKSRLTPATPSPSFWLAPRARAVGSCHLERYRNGDRSWRTNSSLGLKKSFF